MSAVGFEATIQLTVRGPLLIHANEMGPWGVDAVAMRDHTGHLIIPGDQVQGKVREALQEIGQEFDTWDRKTDLKALLERDLPDDDNKSLSKLHSKAKQKNLDNPAKRYPIQFSDFRSVVACPQPGH